MDEVAKKKALRLIPYGLYVVSTHQGDQVNAFTGSWMTQTSFNPPLVAIAVKQGTLGYSMIRDSGVYCVNVLASGQKDLATKFFRHVEPSGSKFADVEYTLSPGGCPILSDGLAWWECKVVDVLEKGDHHVFLGEVVEAGILREGKSLDLKETGLHYGG